MNKVQSGDCRRRGLSIASGPGYRETIMKRRDFLVSAVAASVAASLPAQALEAKKGFDFIQVDVFAQTPLQGNPLAVFFDARGMSDAQMLSITRELNHSETTFILPARAGGDARVRIFGADSEIPFSGHPTLGTAFVMAMTRPGKTAMVLEEGVGPVPVTLERRPDGLFVEMTQNKPVFGAKSDPRMIADMMGFTVDEIDSRYPLQVVSTGAERADRAAEKRFDPGQAHLGPSIAAGTARHLWRHRLLCCDR